MDGEAWWAAVHGAEESRTRLTTPLPFVVCWFLCYKLSQLCVLTRPLSLDFLPVQVSGARSRVLCGPLGSAWYLLCSHYRRCVCVHLSVPVHPAPSPLGIHTLVLCVCICFCFVNTVCHCGPRLPRWLGRSRLQCGRGRFDPSVEKIPRRRKWPPAPALLPGNPRGQRGLAGYRVHGVPKGQT